MKLDDIKEIAKQHNNELPRSKLRGITPVIVSLIEASFGEYDPERLKPAK